MATSKASLQQRKILLLGDSKTGKHSYVTRLIHNRFPNDSSSNKECDISSITRIKIDDTTEIPVQILVIHGSQRGKTKIKKHFKNIDGYIIMFDVTNPESYDNVLGWKKDVDGENKSRQLPSILLANKCDLEKDESMITPMDEMSAYSELFGFCSHFETSCQNDTGIKQSIQHLLREILQRGPRSRSGTPPTPPSPTLSSVSRLPLPPREHTFKIIVIGELGTGKTALIQRYVRNAFTGHYLSTIGSDLQLKKIQYGNDIINIHIWDIAGDERFGVMTHLFYRDAAGCLIVFDVSRTTTLNGAIKWKDDFDAKVNHDATHQIPCVLVGNKCDLMKEGLIASAAHMEEFRRTHNFTRWLEASAKDSTNIVETFSFLVDQIMNNVENNETGRPRTFSEPIKLGSHNHRGAPREHICCNT